jgi:hypothetical protein
MQCKSDGNALMIQSNFSEARDKYSEGIHSLCNPENEGDSQALAVLYLNRSEANIKLQDWGSAVDDSSVAIDMAKYLNEKQLAKAYYRRAHARANLALTPDLFNMAVDDSLQALHLGGVLGNISDQIFAKSARGDTSPSPTAGSKASVKESKAVLKERNELRKLLDVEKSSRVALDVQIQNLQDQVKSAKETISKQLSQIEHLTNLSQTFIPDSTSSSTSASLSTEAAAACSQSSSTVPIEQFKVVAADRDELRKALEAAKAEAAAAAASVVNASASASSASESAAALARERDELRKALEAAKAEAAAACSQSSSTVPIEQFKVVAADRDELRKALEAAKAEAAAAAASVVNASASASSASESAAALARERDELRKALEAAKAEAAAACSQSSSTVPIEQFKVVAADRDELRKAFEAAKAEAAAAAASVVNASSSASSASESAAALARERDELRKALEAAKAEAAAAAASVVNASASASSASESAAALARERDELRKALEAAKAEAAAAAASVVNASASASSASESAAALARERDELRKALEAAKAEAAAAAASVVNASSSASSASESAAALARERDELRKVLEAAKAEAAAAAASVVNASASASSASESAAALARERDELRKALEAAKAEAAAAAASVVNASSSASSASESAAALARERDELRKALEAAKAEAAAAAASVVNASASASSASESAAALARERDELRKALEAAKAEAAAAYSQSSSTVPIEQFKVVAADRDELRKALEAAKAEAAAAAASVVNASASASSASESAAALARERDELRKALEAAKAEAAVAITASATCKGLYDASIKERDDIRHAFDGEARRRAEAETKLASALAASSPASKVAVAPSSPRFGSPRPNSAASGEKLKAIIEERDELLNALDAAKAEAAAAITASATCKGLYDASIKERDDIRHAFDGEARRRAEAETKLATLVSDMAASKFAVTAAHVVRDDAKQHVDDAAAERDGIAQQHSPPRSSLADLSFHSPADATFKDKISNAREQLQQAVVAAGGRASHANATSSVTSALLHALHTCHPQFVVDEKLESEATQIIRDAKNSEQQALSEIEQLSRQLESVDVLDSTAELAYQIRSISQSTLLPQLSNSPAKSRPVSSLSMATKITNQYYSLSSAFSGTDSAVKSPLLQSFAKERDVLKKALEIEVQARHKVQEQALAASRATQLAESRVCSVRAKAAAKEGLLQQALTASERKVQALQREMEMIIQHSSSNHGVAPFLIASEVSNPSAPSPRISLPTDASSKAPRIDFKSVDLFKAADRSSDSALKTLKECGLKLYMSRKDLQLLSNYNQPLFQLLIKMRSASPSHQQPGSTVSTPGHTVSPSSRPRTQGLHVD